MVVPSFLHHPTFKEAASEIEALGVQVSLQPTPGAIPYSVIGGRSNARWWLLPLENRYVTASGLAMFQPILSSAQWMKRGAIGLSRLGLSRIWARPKVYLSGQPAIAQFFSSRSLSFAYFTGTESPHRKVAVQVMDDRGNIKGFAKVTCKPEVRALLEHEAAMLTRVAALELHTADIPAVLFQGALGTCHALVTDTLKTPKTPTIKRFGRAHQDFLDELAAKTRAPQSISARDMANRFRERLDRLREDLDSAWCQRLDRLIETLELQTDVYFSVSLSHGDFTPWNTFVSKGRLYVFDWEYADDLYPASNDYLHFILNQPLIRNFQLSKRVDYAIEQLLRYHVGNDSNRSRTIVMIYALTNAFRRLERTPNKSENWKPDYETVELINIAQIDRQH